jgi:glycosyltransferase involved in cell wall biosynthesis
MYAGLEDAVVNMAHCDIIHILCRDFIFSGQATDTNFGAKAEGVEDNWNFARGLIDLFTTKPVSYSIYSHTFLDREALAKIDWTFSGLVRHYTVASEILHGVYNDLGIGGARRWVIQDGVDTEMFTSRYQERLARFADSPRAQVNIGWVGNSEWSGIAFGEQRKVDHKGLATCVAPAVAGLQREGVPAHLYLVDSKLGFVPFTEMPTRYREMDILVCASLNEGTPNPVMEAMASGVPIVSTNVGIVPEVFGPLQREFLVTDRKPEEFQKKLRRLCEDVELRRRLSEENIQSIKKLGLEPQMERWRQFFRHALDQPAETSFACQNRKNILLKLLYPNARTQLNPTSH